MVGDILQPTHLLFVLLVALVVLGPKRLPEVGRALGDGIRDFRAAINGEHHDHDDNLPEIAGVVSHGEPEPPANLGDEDSPASAPPELGSPPPAPASATPPSTPAAPANAEQPD